MARIAHLNKVAFTAKPPTVVVAGAEPVGALRLSHYECAIYITKRCAEVRLEPCTPTPDVGHNGAVPTPRLRYCKEAQLQQHASMFHTQLDCVSAIEIRLPHLRTPRSVTDDHVPRTWRHLASQGALGLTQPPPVLHTRSNVLRSSSVTPVCATDRIWIPHTP